MKEQNKRSLRRMSRMRREQGFLEKYVVTVKRRTRCAQCYKPCRGQRPSAKWLTFIAAWGLEGVKDLQSTAGACRNHSYPVGRLRQGMELGGPQGH